MKKLKFKRGKNQKKAEVPSRITNETVAEHREKIIAGGRRFKYPMQYSRHKLVFNAILISIVTILLVVGVSWWLLYPQQNTSGLIYRMTRVVPVPVASVEGERVRYSDYLMNYRSSIHYLENKEQMNLSPQDTIRQQDFFKRVSIDDAIADAYAAKLARENDISVSRDDVDAFIESDRLSSDSEISEDSYNAIILDYYDWSPDEYRRVMERKLLRQEVAFGIDDTANQLVEDILERIDDDESPDFDEIAADTEAINEVKVESGVSGFVPRTNRDGGLSTVAARLEVGEVSEPIKATTGDGFYFVKLLDESDTQVSYSYLRIPLTEFESRLEAVRKEGGVNEYIDIPEVETSDSTQSPSPRNESEE